MIWYLLGTALLAWTLLLLVAGERQRRLMVIQAKLREQAAANAPKEPDIPIVR